MVGLDGVGPSTSALSEQRSNHLSYKPYLILTLIPTRIHYKIEFYNINNFWKVFYNIIDKVCKK